MQVTRSVRPLDAKQRPKLRGTLTSKMFRHTYCAARFQTLDRGAPVSLYTVSREMGHGSQDMVERVYSHLGAVRTARRQSSTAWSSTPRGWRRSVVTQFQRKR